MPIRNDGHFFLPIFIVRSLFIWASGRAIQDSTFVPVPLRVTPIGSFLSLTRGCYKSILLTLILNL